MDQQLVDMYERMLKMKDEEIQRLYTLLSKQNVSQTKVTTTILHQAFFNTISHNVCQLTDEDIRKTLSQKYPATKAIIKLLTTALNGKYTNGKLCNISNRHFIEYLTDDLEIKKEKYTYLFDKVFKIVYERCKTVCHNVHENVQTELQNNISETMHSNMMIFVSNENIKAKVQSELLALIKNDAFSN